MTCKIYILLMSCVLTLTTFAPKKGMNAESESNIEFHESGFYSMLVYHNNKVLKASSAEKDIEAKFEISTSKNKIYFKNTLLADLAVFDKKFSYLIDCFKDGGNTFLILSEVRSDYLQSSSDFNTLPRNKLFIYDLKTGKKYQYVYTSPEGGLILPASYYKELPSGITLKSIDTATKTMIFEKKAAKVEELTVIMTEVENF